MSSVVLWVCLVECWWLFDVVFMLLMSIVEKLYDLIIMLSYVNMCGSERNHCCGLIFGMFMLGCLVHRWTVVVAWYLICFRFREEPETSMGVGGWYEYYICIVCRIYASCISEIGVWTLVQWRVSSLGWNLWRVWWLRTSVQDEAQVKRWNLWRVWWFRDGTIFIEVMEPVVSGLISNIPLISKNIGTTCIGV